MKQLPITTAEIWAVPVPKDANNFYSKIVWIAIGLFFRYREKTEYVIVGDFDFEILGTATADEIDFDAAQIVDTVNTHYRNYTWPLTGAEDWDWCETDVEASFRSAIEAAGYYFEGAAQSKVVEKLVIIKKV